MHPGPWDHHTQKLLAVLAWTDAPARNGSVATELELSSAGTTRFPSHGSTTFTFQTHWHLVYLEPSVSPAWGERWFALGTPAHVPEGITACGRWVQPEEIPPLCPVSEKGQEAKAFHGCCFSFLSERSRLRERRGTLSSPGTLEK